MKNSDKILRKLTRIYTKTANLFAIGKFDKALEFFEENENKFENLPRELRTEAEQIHCESLMIISILFSYRGDLVLSFEVAKKILKIAKETNDKFCLLLANQSYGRQYWLSGDLSQALKYFDRAIELGYEIDDLHKYSYFLNSIMMAVRAAIGKGDIEIAKEYFKQVEITQENKNNSFLKTEHHKMQHHKTLYNMTKALILKSSNRFRDKAMAEEIFKAIFDNEFNILNNRLLALIDLCELLINELRFSNDLILLDEIKPLILKLIDFALIINSYYYLIEANILQAKLALITYEINSARRFLTQGQRMAERHGYTNLALEIADLHEELIQQSETWNHLKEINAPVSERMELARLSENLNNLIRVQMSTKAQVYEKKVTVYKERKQCLVCLGDIEGFENYICPNCDSIYCKKCAKALIELENVCWSCESPIDKTKPVKIMKNEKEKIDIKNQKGKK